MSTSSCLDMQYNLSKRNFLRKPSRMLSFGSRQNSSSLPVSEPNEDEMKRVFSKFDRDNDGKISPDDYKFIIRALQKGSTGSTTRDVQKIFDMADLDGDGFIDFKEFVDVQKRGRGLKTKDIHNAFHIFDLDGDGKISAEEVFELLEKLGERCSLQSCREMVRAVDTNHDGAVDIDEFLTMMTQSTNCS